MSEERGTDPILEVMAVSVRFGGVQALDHVDLTALPGQVTGLIGPNGAGKTTLFNIVTGLEKATNGRVLVDGRDVSGLATFQRARLGMGRTFQRLEIFGSLSARDNILTAAEFRNAWSKERTDPRLLTEEIIDRVGLRTVANRRVDAMPTGLARLVELGRALATRPRLLLLDEPGSGLNHEETDRLAELLIDIVGDGTAILLVEHDVELVMKVCTRIHVLDFGRVIAVGTPREVQGNPAVQAAYLGAEAHHAEGVA
jgi:branched-chain amino acid transport system ATP-binding protein